MYRLAYLIHIFVGIKSFMTHIYTGIEHSQVTLSREYAKSLVWADKMYISVLIVELTCNRYNIQSEPLLISCSVFSCKDLSAELGSFCPFLSLLCCSCSFRIIFRISSLLVFILGRGNQSVKFIGSSKLRMGFCKESWFGHYSREL